MALEPADGSATQAKGGHTHLISDTAMKIDLKNSNSQKDKYMEFFQIGKIQIVAIALILISTSTFAQFGGSSDAGMSDLANQTIYGQDHPNSFKNSTGSDDGLYKKSIKPSFEQSKNLKADGKLPKQNPKPKPTEHSIPQGQVKTQ